MTLTTSPTTAAVGAPRAAIRSRLHARLAEHFSRDLAHAASTPAELARWRATYPALASLAALTDLQQLVDDDANAVLTALIDAHQRGSALAGAALLDQMLRKLRRISRYARVSGYGADAYQDRGNETLAAFLTVIATYQPRSGHNVAAELALRTLHAITTGPEARRHEVPCGTLSDPAELGLPHSEALVVPDVIAWTGKHAELDAADVLDWAVGHAAITADEAELLVAAYLSGATDLAALARERGLSHAALRQRLHRSIDRVRAAVCTELAIEPARQPRAHICRRAA